jgi:hypothetical protein
MLACAAVLRLYGELLASSFNNHRVYHDHETNRAFLAALISSTNDLLGLPLSLALVPDGNLYVA